MDEAKNNKLMDDFDPIERAAIYDAKMLLVKIMIEYDIFNDRDPFGYRKLRPSQEEQCVIAGGVFPSLIHAEPINDIDMFILNSEIDILKLLICRENTYRGGDAARFNHAIFDSKIESKYEDSRWIFRNNSDDYLNNDSVICTVFDKVTKFQYILSKHKTRQELLNDFDMVHCTASYVHGSEKKLYISQKIMKAIKNKKIIVNNEKLYAKTSQKRRNKLFNKGWSLPGTTSTVGAPPVLSQQPFRPVSPKTPPVVYNPSQKPESAKPLDDMDELMEAILKEESPSKVDYSLETKKVLDAWFDQNDLKVDVDLREQVDKILQDINRVYNEKK